MAKAKADSSRLTVTVTLMSSFLDEIKLDAYESSRRESLAIVLLSGALNPVHSMHLELLERAAQFVEQSQRQQVVAAVLAPSSDAYIKSKVGKSDARFALSLKHRVSMCKLAIADKQHTSLTSLEDQKTTTEDE